MSRRKPVTPDELNAVLNESLLEGVGNFQLMLSARELARIIARRGDIQTLADLLQFIASEVNSSTRLPSSYFDTIVREPKRLTKLREAQKEREQVSRLLREIEGRCAELAAPAEPAPTP